MVDDLCQDLQLLDQEAGYAMTGPSHGRRLGGYGRALRVPDGQATTVSRREQASSDSEDQHGQMFCPRPQPTPTQDNTG